MYRDLDFITYIYIYIYILIYIHTYKTVDVCVCVRAWVCVCVCTQHYTLARVRDSKLSREEKFVGPLALPPGLVRVQS
jgi:hypothetical protein